MDYSFQKYPKKLILRELKNRIEIFSLYENAYYFMGKITF